MSELVIQVEPIQESKLISTLFPASGISFIGKNRELFMKDSFAYPNLLPSSTNLVRLFRLKIQVFILIGLTFLQVR